MNINLANIDFCPGGKSATLTETTAEILLSETEKVIVPPEGTDGFNKVTITHAPVEESVSATITENGTHTITPSEGFGAMFGVNVDVNVPVGGKCLIGGPEWFNQIEKYSSFFTDLGTSDVSAYVNNTPVIGYGEGIVPKIDSDGNQITDSNGNIVYEKFVPLYTNSDSSFYQNEPSQLYCVTESAPDGKEFLYIRNPNTAKTLDFHNNEYYVEPIFFPIAISDYNTYKYSVWGADVKGLVANCVTFWNFAGDGTHEMPIEIHNYLSQLFIAEFQESLCNSQKIEFGGWIKCTTALRIFSISNRYAILNNPYNTEVNIIISSNYNSRLYDPGLPPFIKKINVVEVEEGSRIRLNGLFYGLKYLTSIPVCDFKNVVDINRTFDNCTALTTLGGFTGLKVNLDLHYSNQLTKESLLNVFNEAADVTASPKTLTLGATNLAKLTDEDKAIATNKGWTLK